MNACASIYFVLFTRVLTSTCVKVTEYHGPDIISESKIELKPIHVPAGLGDIIIISAPIVNSKSKYFLSKPNSETMELNLNISREAFHNNEIASNDEYNDIVIKYLKGNLKAIITPVNKYKIFNLNYGSHCYDTTDTFRNKEKSLFGNEFMIGPLIEEDHGNWVLSVYNKGFDGEWTELFQVITIEITESIPIYLEKPKIEEGEDFELRFAYPIRNLEGCQITAPRTTFDRFYDRDRIHLDYCGFSIPNATKADEGLWRIIGVANIVYEANVYLEISKNSL